MSLTYRQAHSIFNTKYIITMSTIHNSAPIGAIAKTVLMPGDPLRAKFVAENFLDSPELVNSVRNTLTYTGLYKGTRLTVMSSGIGMPSMGLYSYELFTHYGVENIIRIGSTGAYNEALQVGEVVMPTRVISEGSYAVEMNGCKDTCLTPNPEISNAIMQKAQELCIGCKPCYLQSTNVFYCAETPQETYDRLHVDCVDMETFALFHNANVLKKRAACLLTVSDALISEKRLSPEQRSSGFNDMIRLALETAIAL